MFHWSELSIPQVLDNLLLKMCQRCWAIILQLALSCVRVKINGTPMQSQLKWKQDRHMRVSLSSSQQQQQPLGALFLPVFESPVSEPMDGQVDWLVGGQLQTDSMPYVLSVCVWLMFVSSKSTTRGEQRAAQPATSMPRCVPRRERGRRRRRSKKKTIRTNLIMVNSA